MKKATKKVVKAATTPAPRQHLEHSGQGAQGAERGLTQLHKQNYEEALPHFQAILDGYAQEKELVDRVQVYARVCKSKIDARPRRIASPRSSTTWRDARQRGNYDEAVEFSTARSRSTRRTRRRTT